MIGLAHQLSNGTCTTDNHSTYWLTYSCHHSISPQNISPRDTFEVHIPLSLSSSVPHYKYKWKPPPLSLSFSLSHRMVWELGGR